MQLLDHPSKLTSQHGHFSLYLGHSCLDGEVSPLQCSFWKFARVLTNVMSLKDWQFATLVSLYCLVLM
jgi:hypothetical protein